MQRAAVAEPVPAVSGLRPEGRALLAVLGVGATVAALTWRVGDAEGGFLAAPAGVGWLLTDAVLLLAVDFAFARGRPGGAAWVFSGISLWLAGVTAWRASDWSLATALPASVVALAAAALSAAGRLDARRAGSLGGALLDTLRAGPAGAVDAARLPVRAVGGGAREHTASVARGALLGGPLVCLFTVLLSADAGFRHALARIVDASGDGLSFFVWMGLTTAGLLFAVGVLGQVRQGREAALEAARPAPAPLPYRTEGDAPLPAAAPAAWVARTIRPLTWGVVLGQITAVFTVYVLANGRALFEGHDHLRAAGTETYAAYLHTGFFQVSVATLLAVACVWGGHLVLGARGGSRIAGGRALVVIELGLLAVVALTLASCAHRLGLYEEAYGYTYLRLGVWLLQLGIGGLLAITAARSLARGTAGFGAALVWSAALFALLGGSIDADGWIARRNVARARDGARLDTAYLSMLSEDAAPVLSDVAALDRDAAVALASRWDTQRTAHAHAGWRERRGLGAR